MRQLGDPPSLAGTAGMSLLATASGRLEYLATGSGSPVTVFAHGLAGSIGDTRPLGTGVAGTRVFFHFGGHGASTGAGWGYPDLAADLAAVTTTVGATRALGVSMGAGALAALLVEAPDRFERVVFFLPAVLDRPRSVAAREHLGRLAAAVEAGDAEGAAQVLSLEMPPAVRDRAEARRYAGKRAELLLAGHLASALRRLATEVAVADRSALAAVDVPALVVAQAQDELHPVSAAQDLAEALPHASLAVLPPGAMWESRRELRRLVTDFLNG